MCKQNGPCIRWKHSGPLLRSMCTTPSCKWGTLIHRISIMFFFAPSHFAFLLLCCHTGYWWALIELTTLQWLYSISIVLVIAATDLTQIVAAAIKPSPTMILEMGCITLTLQCCPNPRCPARLPLNVMGIPITCLRTTDWIKDHILALGNSLHVTNVLLCFLYFESR